MGLRSWIAGKILKFTLKNAPTPQASASLDDISTEFVNRAVKNNLEVQRIADKVVKANLLNSSTRNLKQSLRNGLEDEDDEEEEDEDDEEEDEGDAMENMIMKNIVQPALEKSLGIPKGVMDAATGIPTTNATQLAEEPVSELRKRAGKTLQNMSDNQLKMLAAKGFI